MDSRAIAEKIRTSSDVRLPEMRYWNSSPCRIHDTLQTDCRRCGGQLFKHQRVGVAWLYAVKRGILADMTGLGKTNQIIGLCCLLKERGELTKRAVIVTQTTAVAQWHAEFARFAPKLHVIAAVGNRAQRISRYASNWDVCVIGQQMMLRDADLLAKIGPGMLVEDDVDALRNPDNATAQTYNRLARDASRVININATPLQIRLQELYSTSVSVGGFEVFGSMRAFERRYVRQEPTTIYNMRTGRKVVRLQTIGYKNMEEFREKIRPFYLRRRYEDIEDVAIPAVAPPEDVWLDLHPPQRKKYEELERGVLRLMQEEGEQVKRVAALARVTYGAEVCAGLPALGEPDGPEASSKLDWLVDKLTGDWAEEKIVVFSRFKGTIRALRGRLKDKNIGMAIIWGDTEGDSEKKMALRKAEQERFWNDPNCRVAIGTTAIARSLNLQVSNIIVNFDTMLNPALMTQILGRVRRVGSTHSHVYVFNLLCRDTQEERYMSVLESRQALADYVWGETSDLYEQLTAIQLLQLIKP